MATIQITSANYNGQTAQITFYSVTAPTTPVNLGPHTIPYSRSGDDVYGSYELNFTAYNKVCNATFTTTTTTAAPGVVGYTMTGAGNSNYNGTYCLDTDSENWFDRVYKNDSNIYLYFKEGVWWTGPIVGSIHGASDGYYSAFSGTEDPSVSSWTAYSCCETELGSAPSSVIKTTCGATTTTTTTTTTTAPGGVAGFAVQAVMGGVNDGYGGTYCEDGTYNGKPKYRKAGTIFQIYWMSDNDFWVINNYGTIGTLTSVFVYSPSSSTPPTTGWNDFDNVGTPIVTATTCGGT